MLKFADYLLLAIVRVAMQPLDSGLSHRIMGKILG